MEPARKSSTEEVPLPRHLAYPPVYIGTYSKPDSDSVFLFHLNEDNGELIAGTAMKCGESPSYLAFDKERNFFYTANELEEAGYVSSFSIDRSNGKVTYLNQQSSLEAPCHLSVDHTNKFIMVANYLGGSVNVYPIQENGQLGPATDFKQHTGSSLNKNRQEKAHAHYVTADPSNQFVFVVDLGIDQVVGYRFDSEKGTLTANEPSTAFMCKPGAGPRHLVFHQSKKYAYLLNELESSLTALKYDSAKGTFTEIETLTTLPDNFKEENTCAAIHLLPNGKFVYVTNRGHNSIVVFQIDEGSGKLTFVERVSTQGKWPRDFGIDLNGRYLIVANQHTNDVYTFHIDQETGKLTRTGFMADVPSPVCVLVVKSFC